MDVVGRQGAVFDLAGHRLGLGHLLRFERSRSSMFLKSMLPPTLSW